MRTSYKNQRGFAVLATSIILSFIVTLNVFMGSKGAVLEQQSVINMYRTQEAFENAEHGIRAMLNYLNADQSRIISNTPIPLAVTGKYAATYPGVADPSVSSTITIVSIGYGANGATRTVSQFVEFKPGAGIITASVDEALTALGTISVSGNTNISSVKAGGDVRTKGSASIGANDGTGVVANAEDFKVALLDINDNPLLDSNGSVIYRPMTTDEYFMRYFGGLCPISKANDNSIGCKDEAKTTIQNDTAKGYVCSSGCTNHSLDEAYNNGKRIFWLEEGGMKINAGVTLGSASDPVLILVMNSGTVQMNGNSKINGVVFVDVPNALINTSCSCTAKVGGTTSIKEQCTKLIADKNGPMTCSKGQTCKGSCSGSAAIDATKKAVSYREELLTLYKTAPWNQDDIIYELTPHSNNPAACTQAACLSAESKCMPAAVYAEAAGVQEWSDCAYPASQVSGSNNTPVQIEILGTWDNSGGGNALIEGAAITSGNFEGQGGIEFVKNSPIVEVFSGSPELKPSVAGWSDMSN